MQFNTIAFAGKPNTPKTSCAFKSLGPAGEVNNTPSILSCSSCFRIGGRITGFTGPSHTPARSRFSTLKRMEGGKLVIASWIGQREALEDRNKGTPSAHMTSLVCSGTGQVPSTFENRIHHEYLEYVAQMYDGSVSL